MPANRLRWALAHGSTDLTPDLGESLIAEVVAERAGRMALTVTNSAKASHQVTTSDGSAYTVIYPDGSTATVASGANHDQPLATGTTGAALFQCASSAIFTHINNADGGWSFDIAALPSGLTYLLVSGQNTITGDIAALPSGLTYLHVSGQNTITGDIAALPSGLTYLRVYGQNTITGDIAALPSGLTYLRVSGQNTITGDIAALPSGLAYLLVYGQNTITGDIAALPSGLAYLRVSGQNTITTLSAPLFPTTMQVVLLRSGSHTVASMEALLNGLSQVSGWSDEKTVDIRSTGVSLSGQSLVYRDQIVAAGATVLHD